MPGTDEVRAKHAEAKAQREARIEAMRPIERMEEAYRLFRLVDGGADAS